MMMYHSIKCGGKKISSSVDMVETVILDYMSHYYDPELEGSKPILLHDTLAHDVASPYQIWLQKVQQLRTHHPDEHSLEFLTFYVTLTLTTEQSNLFTRHFTWWSKQVLLHKDQQFRRHIKKSYFDFMILHCDLDDSKLIFWKTIWLITLHHHTKFGGKRFSDSEYIIWTNIH